MNTKHLAAATLPRLRLGFAPACSSSNTNTARSAKRGAHYPALDPGPSSSSHCVFLGEGLTGTSGAAADRLERDSATSGSGSVTAG
jgi:hypothetical protein